MKISGVIHVSAYYPPHLGGQEIVVQDLATQLALTGEHVEVVTSSRGARTGVSIEDGVRVTRLRSGEFAHTAIPWGLFLWLLRNTRRDTVVHLHVGQFFTPEIVWLTAKIIHYKYILHLHCDLVQSGPLGRFLPLYKLLFLGREIRDSKLVMVLNEEQDRTIRHDYGCDGKTVVMSNGIGPDFFEVIREPSTSKTLELIFVGRLSPHKNLAALVEAIALIRRDIALDIIGDGECRRDLEVLIAEKKLTNVKLQGRLSRNEVKEFYAKSHALILPSVHEVQPIVLLEAMAAGIPVVFTKGIGIEITDREAILIEPTVPGIIDGIERFATMAPDARELLADVARKRAERHRWDTLISSYVQLYDRVSRPSSSNY